MTNNIFFDLQKRAFSSNFNKRNKAHLYFASLLYKAGWITLKCGKKIPDINHLNNWLEKNTKTKKSLILLSKNEIYFLSKQFEEKVIKQKYIKEILKLK